MAIVPVTALPSLPSISSIGGAATAATPQAAQSFGDLVASGLDNVQQAQTNADSLAQQAATGDLTDLHDYMIASTQAQLATDLTVSVRNKAVEAFNEIMRMQV
jgi:flagellar hook-basal body complex protein FliE